MTAETDERTGVSEVSEVQIEGKSGLKLSSCEDPQKVGGYCNGIVHDSAHEIDGEAKDDGDCSYVFVDGADTVSDDPAERDLDTEYVVDHTEAVEGEPVVEGENVSEFNVSSLSKEKQVEVEEFKIDEGETSESCNVKESIVSSSKHDVNVEVPQYQSNGDEAERSDTVEEKNTLESAALPEGNQESLIVSKEAVESELSQLDNEEKVKEKKKAAAEVEENQEFQIMVMEAVDSELHQLNNGEEKVEDQTKLDSVAEIEKNQDYCHIAVTDAVESEMCQLDNGEEVGEKSKSESSAEEDKNQESQIMVSEAIKSELHQLGDGEEKVEEQSKLDSAAEVEEKQDSQVMVMEAFESEMHQINNEEGEVEEQTKLDSVAEIEKIQDYCHIAVTDAVESELHQLDNGEVVEEKSKSESSEEEEKKQESQITVSEDVESVLHQLDNGEEKVEEQSKLDSAAEVEENQDSQLTGAVESEQHQLDNGEEKKTATIPVEEASGVPGTDRELNLETVTCPADDAQLETEATNDTDESGESVSTCPVEHIVSKTEVINDSAEGHDSMSTCLIGNAESESNNVNGSVEKAISLTCPVVDLKSETDVGDISVETGESLPTGHADYTGVESEVGLGSVEICENFPTCSVDTKSETEVTKRSDESDESGESLPSCPVDDTKSEIEVGNSSVERVESMPSCPVDDVKSETGIDNDSIESDHTTPTNAVDDVETEAMNGFIESGGSLSTSPVDDVELESEVRNSPAANNKDMPSADAVKLVSMAQNSSVENRESTPNCVNDVTDVESEDDQSKTGDTDGKPVCEEVEGIEGMDRNGSRPSSSEDSTTDALDGHNVGKRAFRFLIRIPRYVDNKLREQIRLAQLQVDEKTRSRDAIRAAIQSKRATCSEHRDKFEAARSEERAARDVLNAKRQEIDSVQSVINRMKNATSIDEIDDRIHNMEHMIEHETMPLKDEKQLIREIKQLKNFREQLCSSLGRQAELQPMLDQRDRIEERFKGLKQDLDSTRNEVLRTERITKTARKIYFEENDKLKELQAQFRAADDLRQEAYAHLQNLRKQLYEKNKYFRMYQEDVKKAEDYASSGDREALQHICVNQVETIMELWNKNDEFRNEYIRCNIMSTLRRLRTLDGRSLGPDEEPPVLHNFVERGDNTPVDSSKIKSVLPIPTPEQEKSVQPVGPGKTDVKCVVNFEQKNPTAKSKKVTKPTVLENGSATASVKEEPEEKAEEENKQTKEAEELVRKAEELRKEEAAAKLKEQRRLEEKAKAKEAEERKKRNAEKAQARAELRAQKEAELKEKEKERKARKKEKKKVAAAEATNGSIEGESAPSIENILPETTQEPEIKDKPVTVAKRPQKPSLLAKQTKTKVLPPPLRNRSKRGMQPWMWILFTVLVVLALVLVGNIGFSFKFGLPTFGF